MEAFTTSTYKFQDPIENLQIKITLRKRAIVDPTQSSSSSAPTHDELASSSNTLLLSSNSFNASSKNVLEKKKNFKSTSYIFKWQEKVFCPRYAISILYPAL